MHPNHPRRTGWNVIISPRFLIDRGDLFTLHLKRETDQLSNKTVQPLDFSSPDSTHLQPREINNITKVD